MIWKPALVLLALALAVSGVSAGAGGVGRGRYLFENAQPSCLACHNAKRGELSSSRLPRDQVPGVIRSGVREKMPAYSLSPQDLEALADYVVSLRR